MSEREEPLSRREAEYMGNTVAKKIPGVSPDEETTYGEADGPENQDQYDANNVGEDEHV